MTSNNAVFNVNLKTYFKSFSNVSLEIQSFPEHPSFVSDDLQEINNGTTTCSKIGALIFFILDFFLEHSRFTEQQGKTGAISLTTLFQFHSLHRHLNISQVITGESSPLHRTSSRTFISERKSLTTKRVSLIFKKHP